LALKLDTPVVIRYPRGTECQAALPQKALELGKAQVLRIGDKVSPVIWAMGPEVDTALQVAQILEQQKQLNCTVINARFIMPFDKDLALSYKNQVQFSIENHCVDGGLGTTLSLALAPVGTKVFSYGWPREKIPHGDISILRKHYMMEANSIAQNIIEKLGL
jgi:1-deoxy-D-xylulose-5-phosphate synthase